MSWLSKCSPPPQELVSHSQILSTHHRHLCHVGPTFAERSGAFQKIFCTTQRKHPLVQRLLPLQPLLLKTTHPFSAVLGLQPLTKEVLHCKITSMHLLPENLVENFHPLETDPQKARQVVPVPVSGR